MGNRKPSVAMANLLESGEFSKIAKDREFLENSITESDKGKITPDIANIAHTESKQKVILVDPNDCYPWKYADRPEDEMGDIDALANSIAQVGQQEPVLLRPSENKSYKYDIIFGNRRWRACKYANKKLMAIVKGVNDQEASTYQKAENENRKELSDFARAYSYKKQIDEGVFKSQSELGQALGLNRQTLNDIMAFTRIPKELIKAIPSLKFISKNFAAKLAALAKNPDNLGYILQLKSKIDNGSVKASNIGEMIARFKQNLSDKVTDSEMVIIRDREGSKLFHIKANKAGKLSIVIERKAMQSYTVEDVKNLLTDHFTK